MIDFSSVTDLKQSTKSAFYHIKNRHPDLLCAKYLKFSFLFQYLCYFSDMKKTPSEKPKLLAELTQRKMDAQKSGEVADSLRKFQPKKPRNLNTSNVGPSWGRRKGN